MRKLFALLMLGSLLVASNGFALMDDGENSLGAYFDEGTFDMNTYVPAAATPYNMFWVMANCTQASMGGFEFSWYYDPAPAVAPFILDVAFPPGALNIGTNTNLIVGLGIPLVTSEATVLATMNILWPVAPTEPHDVFAGPATPASIAGVPVFNDGADPSLLFPMTFSTYWPQGGQDVDEEGFIAVARVNSEEGPVATEATTLSNVKALFR